MDVEDGSAKAIVDVDLFPELEVGVEVMVALRVGWLCVQLVTAVLAQAASACAPGFSGVEQHLEGQLAIVERRIRQVDLLGGQPWLNLGLAARYDEFQRPHQPPPRPTMPHHGPAHHTFPRPKF